MPRDPLSRTSAFSTGRVRSRSSSSSREANSSVAAGFRGGAAPARGDPRPTPRPCVGGAGGRRAGALARGCGAALSAGGAAAITPVEADALVRRLFACDEPDYTPDGRPVMTVVSAVEAEKRLKK